MLCYDPSFPEHREHQQYFYSRKTANLIIDAVFHHFNYDTDAVQEQFACLCAPSIAEILHHDHGLSVTLLDIDTRFAHLPGFHRFDLLAPEVPPSMPSGGFSLVLFDPPYFDLPVSSMKTAVDSIASKSAHLMVGFLRRDESLLLKHFPTLARTAAVMEYDRVRDSRWSNYALYANCDLPGMRRVTKK